MRRTRRHRPIRSLPRTVKLRVLVALTILLSACYILALDVPSLDGLLYVVYLLVWPAVITTGAWNIQVYARTAYRRDRIAHTEWLERELDINQPAPEALEPPPAHTGSPFVLDRALIGHEERTTADEWDRRLRETPADNYGFWGKVAHELQRAVDIMVANVTANALWPVGSDEGVLGPDQSAAESEAGDAASRAASGPTVREVIRQDHRQETLVAFSDDANSYIGTYGGNCPRCGSIEWQFGRYANGVLCEMCGLALPHRRMRHPVVPSDWRSGPTKGPSNPWRTSGSASWVVTIGKAHRHRHWHKKRLMRDTGFTRYYQCLQCERRWYTQGTGGYQPIDRHWIETGEWLDPTHMLMPTAPFVVHGNIPVILPKGVELIYGQDDIRYLRFCGTDRILRACEVAMTVGGEVLLLDRSYNGSPYPPGADLPEQT
jgi:hypothetical protein